MALVHDFLLDLRGAERVFEAMCDLWPEADVFSPVYDEEGTQGRFAHRNVRTSPLQRLRPTADSFRGLLPLYPWAVGTLDLREYDVIVSSSSAWAHGVRKPPGAVHVCYCHNPFRYAWAEREATLAARSPMMRPLLRQVLDRWRTWDQEVAKRVDTYVANSVLTQERIAQTFGRPSTVLHPPVDLARFSPGVAGEHYVVLGELMPHKRVDVIVEAFNRLGRPLQVVGDGPLLNRLQALAGPTVELLGRLSDADVADRLRSCRALVVAAAEEFGLAVVEALASGRPVIALGEGGALETVTEGVTGTFFEHATAADVIAAVERFDPDAIDPEDCRRAASRFDVASFHAGLSALVDEARFGNQLVRA